jgi:hypothetical protein
LHRNFLLNHVIQGKLHGKIEVTERQGMNLSSYWMIYGRDRKVGTERGRARWQSVENWFWHRLDTCRKAIYVMNEPISFDMCA